MATRNRKLSSILDIGLVASLAAFIGVLVNSNSLAGPMAIALLVVLALAITAIGMWREASKERQLDEVELAASSFGARWGITAVILVTLLATFLPPIQTSIEATASAFETVEGGPFSVPVRLFILGLVCAMVIELTAKSVAAALWRRAKR